MGTRVPLWYSSTRVLWPAPALLFEVCSFLADSRSRLLVDIRVLEQVRHGPLLVGLRRRCVPSSLTDQTKREGLIQSRSGVVGPRGSEGPANQNWETGRRNLMGPLAQAAAARSRPRPNRPPPARPPADRPPRLLVMLSSVSLPLLSLLECTYCEWVGAYYCCNISTREWLPTAAIVVDWRR